MMIVDNADDSVVFFSLLDRVKTVKVNNSSQVTESLSDFLSQSLNEFIFIISRSRNVTRKLTRREDYFVKIKSMNKNEALTLF